MPKGIRTKISKEPQYFDDEILYREDDNIIDCYNHFKTRYYERYANFSKAGLNSNDSKLSYRNYWNIWIVDLRGDFLYFDTDGRMIRLVGDYLKDDVLYKIVYAKNIKLNIFTPLTIVDVTDQKKKVRLYRRALVMKRKKNENNTNT